MRSNFYWFSAVYLAVFILAFTLRSFYTSKDTKPIILPNGSLYEKEWKQIDSLDRQGLPKSALEKVELLYKKAKQENNLPQIVKSIFYNVRLVNDFEEEGYEKAILRFETEIKIAKTPLKQILQSAQTELYYNYFIRNKWQIFNRATLSESNSDDFKTWDAQQFSNKITELYKNSLTPSDSLQRMSFSSIDPILFNQPDNYNRIWPTIYDFLVGRALDAYDNTLVRLSDIKDDYTLNSPKCLDDAAVFASMELPVTRKQSFKYEVVGLLQSWLRFHLELDNPEALLEADLKRLTIMLKITSNSNKDQLYHQQLEAMLKQYNKVDNIDKVRFYLAEWNYTKSSLLYDNTDSISSFTKYNQTTIDLIKTIQSHSKDSILLGKCKYLNHQIHQSTLRVQTEKVIPIAENFPIRITARNNDRIQLKCYKTSEKIINQINEKRLYGLPFYQALTQASEMVYQENIPTQTLKDFQQHTFDWVGKGQSAGLYFIAVEGINSSNDTNNIEYALFNVSNLSFIYTNKDNQLKLFIADRITGKPIENAKVEAYQNEYNYRQKSNEKKLLSSFTSNAMGIAESGIKANSSVQVKVNYNNEVLYSDNYIYLYQPYQQATQIQTFFFTDRQIYRPGQTVYFKALQLKKEGKEYTLMPNESVSVDFYDANYQKIKNLDLKTNEFGSVSGSFIIPESVLTGQMHISSKYGNAYISVEEYKRPNFEVKFKPFDGAYQLNETVNINGFAKAFSGAMISSATVNFSVKRTPEYAWYSRYYYRQVQTQEIVSGTKTTDENGEFDISFETKVDPQDQAEGLVYHYEINVDVVDISGETHSVNKSIRVGMVDLSLSIDIPNLLLNSDVDSFYVRARNLNGEMVKASVDMEIVQLEPENNLGKLTYWDKGNTNMISNSAFLSALPEYKTHDKNEEKIIEQMLKTKIAVKEKTYWKATMFKTWKAGRYKVVLNSVDAFGNKVQSVQYFSLIDEKAEQLPLKESKVVILKTPVLEPGESAEIIVGSAFEKASLLMEIYRPNAPIERQILHLDNAQTVIKIPITEKDRGNVNVSFSMIYKNRVYLENRTIIVPFTNRNLDIEFETFRDKLYPGQDEQWKVKIKGSKGEKVAAEFLATMYDASLDEFAALNWNFNILNYFYQQSYYNASGFNAVSSILVKSSYNYFSYPSFMEPKLNWFGFLNNYRGGHYKYASKSMALTQSFDGDTGIESEAMYEEAPAPVTSTVSEDESRNREEGDKFADNDQISAGEQLPEKALERGAIQVRTNFNETAFFFPQLKTDSEGNIIFSFTMPESLTKWNFRGFAHTKDLKYSFINKEIVTQKDLMLVPNVPRFVREGDRFDFSVKVVNMSDKTVDAKVKIEFIDLYNGKVITDKICRNDNAELSIKTNQSGLVKFPIEISEGLRTISYRVVAKAGSFSDGEERPIPVLPNRMLVTESLPLPVNGKGTHQYTFKTFKENQSATVSNYNYTLEMTSNPVWYAVQALPYLSEYPYECAEQTFSRFYANTLAEYIAKSDPSIQNVFNVSKQQKSSEALLSNLEKNEELKSLIIQETPWLLDAQNESEQKRRIALLFDLNNMSQQKDNAFLKLKQMQLSNGAWPWFNGMGEDRYITQVIVAGFGHLYKIGAIDIENNDALKVMLFKAIKYLDQELEEDYSDLKINYDDKQLYAKSFTSNMQVQYLYGRSFFINILNKTKKFSPGMNYFTKNSRDFWLSYNLYAQGLIAITSINQNIPKTGIHVEDLILKSLKEKALHSEEMGMYWKEGEGWYWYELPIERQSVMIELFEQMNETKSVADLKTWLLKQKQTQNWPTTRSTADAIYALLMQGTSGLTSTELVEVTLGGKPISLKDEKIEAGSGYYKKSWTGNAIDRSMADITINKKDDGIAWGAVYWQYFENLDKIQTQETGLSVQKMLYVEQQKSGLKPELIPVTDQAIKVGDKVIVRLIIRTDRNLEYVHLKDMRAAGLEPLNVFSGYKWSNGLGYYESTKDASTNFFFDKMNKGTYVFEYPLRANMAGTFSNGISSMQCMYAPEFTTHSQGQRISIH
ncbi:MAG: hypothetical protein JXR60_08705 [Bacteroidales bacterium]|nr:hypothetical protein [Bacteroidales bacterium]